jgi:hypothetical protein
MKLVKSEPKSTVRLIAMDAETKVSRCITLYETDPEAVIKLVKRSVQKLNQPSTRNRSRL